MKVKYIMGYKYYQYSRFASSEDLHFLIITNLYLLHINIVGHKKCWKIIIIYQVCYYWYNFFQKKHFYYKLVSVLSILCSLPHHFKFAASLFLFFKDRIKVYWICVSLCIFCWQFLIVRDMHTCVWYVCVNGRFLDATNRGSRPVTGVPLDAHEFNMEGPNTQHHQSGNSRPAGSRPATVYL